MDCHTSADGKYAIILHAVSNYYYAAVDKLVVGLMSGNNATIQFAKDQASFVKALREYHDNQ